MLLTATLAGGRSKRGFFLLVSTVPLHLKTRLICLSSRSLPALSSLQERGVPSLLWVLCSSSLGAETGRRKDQRVEGTQFSCFTLLLSFRCRTQGADRWADFLATAPGKDRGNENLSKSDLGLAPWSKKKMASAGSPSNCRLVLASCVLRLS